MSTTIDRLIDAIASHRFACTTEAQLQEALARVFALEGLGADREAQLTESDRIDFLVEDVGVEVKIDGSASEIGRQLSRYAQSERVHELVLVTTRRRHQHDLDGTTFNGKAVRVVRVGGVL